MRGEGSPWRICGQEMIVFGQEMCIFCPKMSVFGRKTSLVITIRGSEKQVVQDQPVKDNARAAWRNKEWSSCCWRLSALSEGVIGVISVTPPQNYPVTTIPGSDIFHFPSRLFAVRGSDYLRV